MTDTNQSLRVNGQTLSNLDSDLVITLDDHPVVQISKIEESTITYSFLGDVEQETTYNLNLTFLYKGTHKLVVPMTFIHKPTVITTTPITQNVTIWEEGEGVPFTVDVNGTDKTSSISNVVIADNAYVTGTPTGWYVQDAESTEHTENVVYTYDLQIGDDTRSETVTVPFVIAAWDGVIIKGTVDPDTVSAANGDTGTLKVKVIQRNNDVTSAAGVYPGTVMLDYITLGDASYADGFLNIPWTATKDGDDTLNLKVNVFGGEGEGDVVTLPVKFTITEEAVEPTIEDGTTDMTLNLWDTKPINYKVMLGDTDITSSVTNVVDRTDPNDAIELVKVDDTHWGYQAVTARTDEDLIIDAMVDVYVTYQGTEHVIPMTIDVVVKANTTGIPANRFNIEFV